MRQSETSAEVNKCRNGLRSFQEVHIPDGTKKLQLSDNHLVDFSGFDPIDSLEELNVDRNPLISFRGFPVLKNLKYLSLVGSPVSKLPNFRALAILVAGFDLLFLNSREVTTSDRSSALAYDFDGDTRSTDRSSALAYDFEGDTRSLIVRGWIPRRPVAAALVPRVRPVEKYWRSIKKTADPKWTSATQPQRKLAQKGIRQLVDRQELDPISVRITRTLRAIGYSRDQICECLRTHFGPTAIRSQPKAKPPRKPSLIESEIDERQREINDLARQLHLLRTGNQALSEYEAMIDDAGRNLRANRKIVEGYKSRPTVPQTQAPKPDHQGLTDAVIAYLHADQNSTDRDLIDLLNGIADAREEEEDIFDLDESGDAGGTEDGDGQLDEDGSGELRDSLNE
jgi:hypothetical protein